MSRWFRLYDELLDDPKVQRLAPADFKGWINILCLTSRNGGKLPPLCDVAFALRETDDAVSTLVERLRSAGLIVRRSGGSDGAYDAPYRWEERQYKSDTSTDRVKRFRQRSKVVAETADETAPETEADTDTETEVASTNVDVSAEPTAKPLTKREVIEAWQSRMVPLGFPAIARMTGDRERKLNARLKDSTLDEWQRAMDALERSAFCKGENDRGWRADFDFLLQPKSFTGLLEGKYDH